jgi:hypothetical protein
VPAKWVPRWPGGLGTSCVALHARAPHLLLLLRAQGCRGRPACLAPASSRARLMWRSSQVAGTPVSSGEVGALTHGDRIRGDTPAATSVHRPSDSDTAAVGEPRRRRRHGNLATLARTMAHGKAFCLNLCDGVCGLNRIDAFAFPKPFGTVGTSPYVGRRRGPPPPRVRFVQRRRLS